MSRFTERLQRADKVVDRTFAEELPVVLMVGAERRPITAIFEKPDATVEVYGGGEIRDVAPALSAYTTDIQGLAKRHAVTVGTEHYWVTHTQPHKAQADQQAKAKKTQAKRNEQRMNITAPCRPQHLPLTAEARVTTQGFGQREDRSWLIESMVYSLTSGGLSVAFNLATDIKPKATSGKKNKEKKDKTGPEYFGKQKN